MVADVFSGLQVGAPGRALVRVVLVVLLAAVAEVVPLGFAIYGGVLLLAWLEHRWDASWNDGDAWFAGVAVMVLVIIVVVAGSVVRVIARAGGLPPRATVMSATSAALIAAALVLVALVLGT